MQDAPQKIVQIRYYYHSMHSKAVLKVSTFLLRASEDLHVGGQILSCIIVEVNLQANFCSLCCTQSLKGPGFRVPADGIPSGKGSLTSPLVPFQRQVVSQRYPDPGPPRVSEVTTNTLICTQKPTGSQ